MRTFAAEIISIYHSKNQIMNRVNLVGKITFAVIMCVGLLTSCNKYEEGPKFSLKTKTSRLSNNWYVDEAHFSYGEDSIDDWKNGSVEFKKDGTYIITKFSPDQTMKTEESGTWVFINKKTQLQTTGIQKEIDVASNVVLSEYDRGFLWRITKLEKNEVRLWQFYGTDGTYEALTLKPLE